MFRLPRRSMSVGLNELCWRRFLKVFTEGGNNPLDQSPCQFRLQTPESTKVWMSNVLLRLGFQSLGFRTAGATANVLRFATSTMDKEVSELSVPVPWGQIRGRVWGPDHGYPVLCLHGWADNCGSFKTLIPLLPAECRYVTVDLVGHGLSSHLPPGAFYSSAEYVADVARVAAALQLKKFSIIAHSMGGDIAAMFTALYPEMVEALILLDTYGFLPTDSAKISEVMRQGMDSMLQFENKTEEKPRIYTYEKAAQRLTAANPSLSERSVHILLERGLTPVEGGFVFSRDLRVNFKNIMRISLEQSLVLLSKIQASVLLILAGGGSDRMLSESAQDKFTSTLLQHFQDRNHSVVTVPGDHHVHLNNPEAVAPFVCDFLKSKTLSQLNSPQNKL